MGERRNRSCHIELLTSKLSSQEIVTFLIKNRITPYRDNFHSTIYYSESNPLFQREEFLSKFMFTLPITIFSQTYFFDFFSVGDCLVLRYENERVRGIKRIIDKEISRQFRESGSLNSDERRLLKIYQSQRQVTTYSLFNPHIMLSRYPKVNLEGLPNFEKQITFDNFK